MNNIKMLYYDRIDISEEIDINKTSALKECDICQNWYFLNIGFKIQPFVCKTCHELLMMSMTLSDIAILEVINSDYYCIIYGISKSKAIKQKKSKITS